MEIYSKKIHTWFFLLTIEFACQRHNDWICLSKDKSRSVYSLEGFASPGLRSQLHKSMNIYIYTHYAHCFSFGHADKSYFDFDWSEFDVTTIFDSTCKKDQKQKAEFNLYLYIYIYSWLVMICQYWKLKRILREMHTKFYVPFYRSRWYSVIGNDTSHYMVWQFESRVYARYSPIIEVNML